MPELSTNHTFSTPFHIEAGERGSDHPCDPLAFSLPDLRRRNARLHSEQISLRARFLPKDQRALISAIYEQGQSCVQVAAMCGLPVRGVRREVQKILHRLATPEFTFVALHMDSWCHTMRRVAQCCVLGGVPVRRASATLRLSLHTVRKDRSIVRHLASGAHAEPHEVLRSRAG